jgi:hypothetical protein
MHENEHSVVPGPLFRLSQIPTLSWLPRRHGKPPSIATVYRWASDGLDGKRLRVIRAGGALATTEAWLLEFFQDLTEDTRGSTQPPRTPVSRERARARAAAELEAAGI